MLIAGCLFVGIGVGMWLGDVGPGAVVGLGVGFLLQYLFGEHGVITKRRKASGGDNNDVKVD